MEVPSSWSKAFGSSSPEPVGPGPELPETRDMVTEGRAWPKRGTFVLSESHKATDSDCAKVGCEPARSR
eukprot:3090251-Pleurochrysis_carterae.AAC.1